MIELLKDQLIFLFPDVHANAECKISFKRTLRIPDDNREYPLPPGLGNFPLRHIDDYVETVPDNWLERGGVLLPMYQAEALWIAFSATYGAELAYPFAIKIAAGKINAVSGNAWSTELDPDKQDYVAIPGQPWLDGFNVSEGHVRQFVAMPLGEGYTAEEQLTGKAEFGGLQILVYPMKAEIYNVLLEKHRRELKEYRNICLNVNELDVPKFSLSFDMGLAQGGLMKQTIEKESYGIDAWDLSKGQRCFIHLCNSESYTEITGDALPHKPPTAKDYSDAGLPWFEYYSDGKVIGGSSVLNNLKSVATTFFEKEQQPLPDNQAEPLKISQLNKHTVVRQSDF